MLLQLGQSTDVEISNSLIQNFQQYISNTLNVLFENKTKEDFSPWARAVGVLNIKTLEPLRLL